MGEFTQDEKQAAVAAAVAGGEISDRSQECLAQLKRDHAVHTNVAANNLFWNALSLESDKKSPAGSLPISLSRAAGM